MNQRRQRLVLWFGALLLTLSLLYPKGHEAPPGGAGTVALRHERGRITVRVAGQVRHPGVYQLTPGSTPRDLLKLADPDGAPAAGDNLPLVDGALVTVSDLSSEKPRVTVGAIPVRERLILDIPLDPAIMSAADWELLPGIGPALAKRIMAYAREHGGIGSPDELTAIPGIGEATVAKLRPLFRTESP